MALAHAAAIFLAVLAGSMSQARAAACDQTINSAAGATISFTSVGQVYHLCLTVGTVSAPTDDSVVWGVFSVQGTDTFFNAPIANSSGTNAGNQQLTPLDYSPTTAKASYTFHPTNPNGNGQSANAGQAEVDITLNSAPGNGQDSITLYYAPGCSDFNGGCTGNTHANTAFVFTINLPAPLPPTVTAAFSPTSVTTTSGSSSTLTLTITNPNASTQLTGVAIAASALPAGLSGSNLQSTCSGTPGFSGGSLSLSGATLNASASCTITLTISSAAPGNYTYTTGTPSATGPALVTGTAATTPAALTVTLQAPTIAASFSPTSITNLMTATLTLTISNGNVTALSGLAVAGSALPANLNGSSPSTTCGGTASLTGSSLSLSGGTLTANSSCTVTLTVSSNVANTYTYTTGVVSAAGPASTTGTTATTSPGLTVTLVTAPTIAAAFSPTSITTAAGSTSTLTLTISNPNSSTQLTGVAVAASALPVNLSGTGAATTCGGSATFSGGNLSLSGGTLNASASCTVTLTVSSTTPGNYTYATGVVSASGPASLTGATATTPTALTVTAQAPAIAAAFSPTAITTVGTSTLTLTITNPNTTLQLTALAVGAGALPANLNGTNPQTTCSGGTANFAGGSLSLSGATLNGSSSCTVTLTVSSATPGNYNYTTGTVSASNSPAGTTATTPTALNVSTLTNPNIAAAFSPTAITTSQTATLTLTINNPNAVQLTGLAMAASALPANLNGTNQQTTCGGSVNLAGGNLSLSGGSVSANGSCTVTLTVSSSIPSNYTYTTGAVSATGPGPVSGAAATTPTALTVTAGAPAIAAAFSPTSVSPGQTSTLTLTITNPNTAVQLTGLAVAAGTLPANLNGSGAQTTCGGAVTFAANSLSLSGGTLNASASCTVTLTVSSLVAAAYSYTSGTVSATGPSAVTGTTATTPTPLTVNSLATPNITAAFSPTAITTVQTSTLTLTITNPNGPTTLTGLAVAASALPAGLSGSNPQTTCGGSASLASGNLSLSGGTIAGNGSCTVTLTISASAAGSFSFTTGAVSATGPVSLTGPTATTSTALAVSLRTVTTTALTSSQNPSSFGQAVTFTATVAAASGTPTGVVTFNDGGTAIGAANLSSGVAAFTTTTLAVGSHTITASYGGSVAFTPSTSPSLAQTVNVPADSVRLRALQLEVTKVIAQNSGQAISGAIDDAISEGFTEGGIFITPGQTSLRFNFAADPVDPDEQGTSSRKDPTLAAANAYSPTDGSPAGRGRYRDGRIDDALNSIDQRLPRKAPPKRLREQRDWLFWIDVRGSGVDRWASSTTIAGTATLTQSQLTGLQLNALAGLTYRVAPNFVVGALGGYETFNFTEQDINGKLTGEGWTVGAYLGWKIVPTLRYEAAVAYSGISYNGAAGLAQGNFSGERWLAQTGLTGTYKAWGIVIEPSAKVYVLWEHEGAYVDSLGTAQGNSDFATGRASAGVKVSYPVGWAGTSILLAPYLGAYGDYYFTEDNAAVIVLAGGVPLVSNPLLQGWSARMIGGVGAKFENGGSLALGGEYGGIGANFQTWTVRAKAQVPFVAR